MAEYRLVLDTASDDTDIQDVENENAVRLLTKGTAQLAPEQRFAPTELADLLKYRAADLASLGPPTDVPKRMQRINERLFSAGIRQNIADGYPLRWCEDKRQLRRQAEMYLSGCEEGLANLFQQIDLVFRHYVKHNGQLVRSFVQWSETTLKGENLIPRPSERILYVGGDWEYLRVQPPWRRLYEALQEIEDIVSATIEKAFSEGRIICAQTTLGGERYIPPSTVDLRRTYSKERGYSYLFSRDLPGNWFDDFDTLPKRRAAAKLWINETGAHFAAQGKRTASGDLKAVAQEKFDLSANAVQEIWVKCDFLDKGKKGAIPADQRVSINEIRALK